jgi:molybdopterin-guanine dinucleotide biosynthesis protein A
MPGIVTGLVLAGGRSSRFGADKALAPLRGCSLLERAVQTLTPSTSDIAVNAQPGSGAEADARRQGLSVVHDQAGLPRGPLAGIVAGLEWSRSLEAQWMISLPCDVVSVPSYALESLIAAAGKANGAYVVTAQGPQSLCAVWPVENKEALEAALITGMHPPVRDILRLMGASAISFDEAGAFLNINTKDDLLAAEKALSG